MISEIIGLLLIFSMVGYIIFDLFRRNMECQHLEGFEVDSMGTFICSNCGALFVKTPFGFEDEIIAEDARTVYPESKNLPVKRWRNKI